MAKFVQYFLRGTMSYTVLCGVLRHLHHWQFDFHTGPRRSLPKNKNKLSLAWSEERWVIVYALSGDCHGTSSFNVNYVFRPFSGSNSLKYVLRMILRLKIAQDKSSFSCPSCQSIRKQMGKVEKTGVFGALLASNF